MKSFKLDPYLSQPKDWKQVLKGKHLLFDTDALISILAFKAESIFEDFKALDTKNCLIHPVYVELRRCDKEAEIFKRLQIIKEEHFSILPLTKEEIGQTNLIQDWLSSRSKKPSVTDLYLGGFMARYSHSSQKNIILLSGNISDFIFPLFKREASIILQNDRQSKLLHCLSLNSDILETFGQNMKRPY